MSVTDEGPGMAHVRSTVAKMADLATKGMHTYEIRNLATRITHDVPSKQVLRELFALYRWVRDHIRYRFDPLGLEWLQSPMRTVKERAGDCDDMSILLAALAGALGHRWEFDTVGATPQAQQHVAVRVFAGKHGWVTLDPVLEPPQETTAPRSDVGTFAAEASGAHLRWNNRGEQMSGVGTLGMPASDRQRELWLFSSYYTNPQPYGGADGGIPLPGVPAIPDPNYGSPDRPGFYRGSPKVLSFAPGVVEQRYARHADGLGRVPYTDSTLGFGFLKKIGKAVGKVAKVAGKVPGIEFIPGAAGAIKAGKLVGKVAKLGGKKKRKRRKKRRGKARARGAGRARAAGGAFPPNYVTRSDVRDMRQDIMALARLSTRADIAELVRAMRGDPPVPGFPKPDAFDRRKKRRRRRKGKKRRGKKKARRFQAFDRKAGVFRVFKRKGKKRRRKKRIALRAPKLPFRGRARARAGVSGVGKLRPQVTFSLLGAAPDVRDKASAALSQVTRFFQRTGKPPAIRLAAVRAFQEADGQLKADSLYGNNTRVAMAYWLGVNPQTLPPARWKTPVTWRKPEGAPPAAPPVVSPPIAPPSPPPVVPPPELPPPPAPPVVVAPPPRMPSPMPAPAPLPAPQVPPVNVPGFQQVATSPTDPGLPPLPVIKTKPKPRDVNIVPVIKTAVDAPAVDKPRPATAEDVVAMAKHQMEQATPAERELARQTAKANGQPPPRVPTEAEAKSLLDAAAAAGKPVILPPLKDRAAAGLPPVPSDRAVVAMPPPPAHPVPPVGPGQPYGEGARPLRTKGDDDTLLWLALGYLYLTRKS